jgi:hypothetical protein
VYLNLDRVVRSIFELADETGCLKIDGFFGPHTLRFFNSDEGESSIETYTSFRQANPL